MNSPRRVLIALICTYCVIFQKQSFAKPSKFSPRKDSDKNTEDGWLLSTFQTPVEVSAATHPLSDVVLQAQETRGKKSPSRRTRYKNHNRSSGGRTGDNDYYQNESYNGNQGYSDYTTFNKARKENYANNDDKVYGDRDGGSYGGGYSDSDSYGGRREYSDGYHNDREGRFGNDYRGKYAHHYSDNGDSFLDPGH